MTGTATCDEVRSTRLHYRLRCLLHPATTATTAGRRSSSPTTPTTSSPPAEGRALSPCGGWASKKASISEVASIDEVVGPSRAALIGNAPGHVWPPSTTR